MSQDRKSRVRRWPGAFFTGDLVKIMDGRLGQVFDLSIRTEEVPKGCVPVLIIVDDGKSARMQIENIPADDLTRQLTRNDFVQ